MAEGVADMVGMARAHIADPAIVTKAQAGREDETIPCIACNQGCAGMLAMNLPITCLSNPRSGREVFRTGSETTERHRVLVVGGGPGGLEAAGAAADAGHDVTLWEAGSELGGRLNWTRAMLMRVEFARLLDYLAGRCERAGVAIETGRRASFEAVTQWRADAVMIATGASQPGEVFSGGGRALSLEEALSDTDALGEAVATTASVAEYLADLGKSVTMVVPTGAPAWTISMYSVFALRRRLKEKRVRIAALHAPLAYLDGMLTLADLSTGEQTRPQPVDAVIAPTTGVPNDDLFEQLRGSSGCKVGRRCRIASDRTGGGIRGRRGGLFLVGMIKRLSRRMLG